MSEAGYTHAVPATTSAGGTTPETLNDAYDGYETLCISIDNNVERRAKRATPTSASTTRTVPPRRIRTAPVDREFDFNDQTINGLTVSREVFVPDNDSFARWLDIVHNPGSTTADATLLTIANNLGSDNNTVITDDSSGNTTPTTSDRVGGDIPELLGLRQHGPPPRSCFRRRWSTRRADRPAFPKRRRQPVLGATTPPRARPDPDHHELRRRPAKQGRRRLQVGSSWPSWRTPTSSTA